MINRNVKVCIWMIAGLPGSGKTFLAQKIKQEEHAWLIDDPMDRDEVEGAILKGIESGYRKFIICDPYFCEGRYRLLAEQNLTKMVGGPIQFNWVFFEKDIERCRANVVLRGEAGDDRMVEGSLRRFSKTYDIPEGATTIPVWRTNHA